MDSDPTLDALRENGRALMEAFEGLTEATRNALADSERLVRSGVESNPYALLGTAFAVGWILGGGVPLRLAALATSALGRAALGLAAVRLAEAGATSARGNGSARPASYDS